MNNKFLTAGVRYIGNTYSRMDAVERLEFCKSGVIPERFNKYIEVLNKIKRVY